MKNILRLSLLAFLISFSANAQKFEVTAQGGYQFNGKWNYNGGYFKIPGSGVYGVTAGLNAGNGVMVEFFWLQQNSELRNKDVIFNPIERTVLDDITVNHYQFGAVQNFGYDDLKPFIGGSLGWSVFSNNDESEPIYDHNSTFTVGVTGGIKYYFTDNIGLRFQAQMLLPVNGGGVYIGGGSGIYASGTMLLFNMTGGLVIGFGG